MPLVEGRALGLDPPPRERSLELTFGEAAGEESGAPEAVESIAALTAGELSARRAAHAEATARRLIARLADHLQPGLEEDTQHEVAALIALISDLAYEEFTEFFPLVSVAVDAVLSDPPNLTLAMRLRRAIRRRTHLLLRPLLFLRVGHPAVQVILGLNANLYLAVPVLLLLLPPSVRGSLFPGRSDYVYLMVAFAGMVGSIVSILVRIRDFDDQKAEHRAILFFTGFFKPLIGAASALFAVIILEAGLIPLEMAGDRQTFFFLALAFVAGFSERLASDLVSRTESGVLIGASKGPGEA